MGSQKGTESRVRALKRLPLKTVKFQIDFSTRKLNTNTT